MLKHILFAAVLAGNLSALNYDEALEKLLDSFRNKLENFRADVTEEVKLGDMSEPKLLRGTMTVKAPGKLLLEYTAPVKQSIISDGKTLWIYFKEQNQVVIQDVSEVKSKDNIIFQLPKYLEYLKEKYIGSLKEEEKHDEVEAVLLEFVPRDEGEDFTKITLWADKEKWLPLSSTVFIGDGNSITVKFSKIKTNELLEDSLFDFKVPEGAEKITSLLR